MTYGQARCLTTDSVRAAYWQAWGDNDIDALRILRAEMRTRRILP